LSARGQLVRYISLVTDDLQYARFRAKIREVAPTTEKAIMTIAEELRAEGLEKGIKKGIRKGIKQGLQRTLVSLLRLKFGELSDDDLARLQRLDEAALEGCLARVLVADSVAAVFGD
jgi:predicted transposase YdaD